MRRANIALAIGQAALLALGRYRGEAPQGTIPILRALVSYAVSSMGGMP